MFKYTKNIQIQGEFYTIEQLQYLCEQKINSPSVELWEKDIYLFIRDWFSKSDTINVSTSGSTGKPKSIILKKAHMIASAKATISFFSLKKGDNVWLCLPVKYIAGKMMIVRSIVGELNLVYSEPTSIPFLNKYLKVDFAAMVPNQVHQLLKTGEGLIQLKKVNNLLIGGAGISDELEKRLVNLPEISVWHSYGMTETITHIAIRSLLSKSMFGNYYPLHGIKVRVNNNSQLIINAPEIGVNNLITNDIAVQFDDNSFSVIGRVDNVIISGGIKLHPEIIEAKIKKYISNNFFVGGIPDSVLGQKLVLFIEENASHNCDFIHEIIKQNLSKYEIPKEIIFLKDFLRTENGKLRRNVMVNSHVRLLK
jgi:O-succinylbenzoic acid--CoA ligase